jgi:hypothetical protein
MIFAVMGILSGIVLGARFRVFVLVPAMALACAVIAGVSASVHDTPWSTAVDIVVTATALQVGYFAGLLMRGLRTGRAFGPQANAISDIAH